MLRPFLFFLAAIVSAAGVVPAPSPAAHRPGPQPVRTFPPVFESPPILMYHRIDVDRPADAIGRELTVTPAAFAAQLRYLRTLGMRGIGMAELARRLRADQSLRDAVVLTFDDGYSDQYKYAFPALQRARAWATFYVVTGNVGRPRHLSWTQLRTMLWHGLEVGCHGLSHDDLSEMTQSQQGAEILGCLHEVRRRLGTAVDSYAYPSGRFDAQTIALVRRAGIALALTTDPIYVLPPQNRFELTRLRVRGSWGLADFKRELARARAHLVRVLR